MLNEKLENFVEITSGQIMSRIVAKEDIDEKIGSWKVIVPKAITSEGTILVEELPEEELKAKPDDKRITALNDIVIKLSTPFDSAIVTEETVGCVVPSFCAIIRNNNELDIDYLRAFLNSKTCKEQLRQKVTGAVMSILSIGKIKEVEIPIPDRKEQKDIGDRYKSVQEKMNLMRKIVELENKRNDIVFQELMK